MEQQQLETPSPNASSSPKRVLEDQADSNPPKRLKGTAGGDDDGGSKDNCTSDNDKQINPYSSPEPQPPSRTGEVLPSIEVNHEPNNEGNELLYDVMSDSILEIIEKKDQFRTPLCSPRTRPTTSERRLSSSTNTTQQSWEPSAENGPANYPLPSSSPPASSASSPSPSPSPVPAPAPVPSPSPPILLAELPCGLLSPTPVSSVTASPTPPASRWVDFSPRSPFSSSYTSISEGEGDSDDEGWLDDEEWLNAAAAAAAVLENADDDDEEWLDLMGQLMEEEEEDDELGDFFLWEVPQILEEWIVPVSSLGAQEVEAAFVDGSGNYDGDEEDDGDGPESTAGQNIFAPRYDSWPDFDHSDVPGGAITDYISDDESEWDIESDPLHEGPRYPGMNAFKLEGYTPVHDQPPDSGDQEPEETYITDDEDEESDGDDEDEDEDVWVAECKSELEAQWWGAEMRIIHYHPSMCI
ncbi:hypothetical protein N0V85_007263 [Neurospora sp. IMI 360204]|nr:hypothetical protein N0V85_007263 [Neurospora sp. IMI 360204]